MKIVTAKLSPRVTFAENRSYGILNYDKDNLYPQNLDMIIGGSGTATACIEAYSTFIRGAGFKAGNDVVVCDLGYAKITLHDLLGDVVDNFSRYDGFAVHVNYNAKYKIKTLQIIDFDFCRLGKPDDEDYVGKIAVYNNWDRRKPRGRIEKKKIDWIDRFNPDPKIIAKQVERAGGWRKYKGQLAWVSRAGIHTYPKSIFDPVLEDVETDSMIKTAKYKGIINNFSAGHLFVHKGAFETEKERKKFVESLNEFQGAEHQGSILMVECEVDEQAPEIKPFVSREPAERFKYTEKSIQDNIRKMVRVPPVLIGDLIVGRLGTAEEIYDAVALFNIFTLDERQYVTKFFEKLMVHFDTTESLDLEIEPVKIFSEEDVLQRKHAKPTTDKNIDDEPDSNKE